MKPDEATGLVAGILCILLGIVLVIFAVQLFRGKWYRLIAGNHDADAKTIEEQKEHRLGRGVGIILLLAAFMVFCTAGTVLSRLS